MLDYKRKRLTRLDLFRNAGRIADVLGNIGTTTIVAGGLGEDADGIPTGAFDGVVGSTTDTLVFELITEGIRGEDVLLVGLPGKRAD